MIDDCGPDAELVVPAPGDTVRITPSRAADAELLKALGGLRAMAVGARIVWHRLREGVGPPDPAFGAAGWLLWRDRRLYHVLLCEARRRGLR